MLGESVPQKAPLFRVAGEIERVGERICGGCAARDRGKVEYGEGNHSVFR